MVEKDAIKLSGSHRKRKLRISHLLVFTGWLSFCLAVLSRREFSDFEATLFVSLSFAIIWVAGMKTFIPSQQPRHHWASFFVFSIVYLSFAYVPDEYGNSPRQYGDDPPTRFLRLCFENEWSFGLDLADMVFDRHGNHPAANGATEDPFRDIPATSDREADEVLKEIIENTDSLDSAGFYLKLGEGQTVVPPGAFTFCDRYFIVGHCIFALTIGSISFLVCLAFSPDVQFSSHSRVEN